MWLLNFLMYCTANAMEFNVIGHILVYNLVDFVLYLGNMRVESLVHYTVLLTSNR